MSDMLQITDHTLPPAGRAAGTKWNFHPYSPGLVGGHCIPVDPYYLVHKAEEVGYHPQVILAGRAINDHMPKACCADDDKGAERGREGYQGVEGSDRFFHKKSSKNCPSGGVTVFGSKQRQRQCGALSEQRR
jgi:UDP-N-acetyl-D-mannosaminuronate dehydrogenase